jgi:hypothetical protein
MKVKLYLFKKVKVGDQTTAWWNLGIKIKEALQSI